MRTGPAPLGGHDECQPCSKVPNAARPWLPVSRNGGGRKRLFSRISLTSKREKVCKAPGVHAGTVGGLPDSALGPESCQLRLLLAVSGDGAPFPSEAPGSP